MAARGVSSGLLCARRRRRRIGQARAVRPGTLQSVGGVAAALNLVCVFADFVSVAYCVSAREGALMKLLFATALCLLFWFLYFYRSD